MFISKKKKQENIIEYILYMWQIEDLIRSCNFDIGLIEKTVIEKSPYSDQEKHQLKEWYLDLMHGLEAENKQDKGHLNQINSIVDEIEKVHHFLINIKQHKSYHKLYIKTAPLINELRKKGEYAQSSELNICLEFIYGYLLLRLQNKSISKSTSDALKLISIFCYDLAEKYKDYKQGYLSISEAQKN